MLIKKDLSLFDIIGFIADIQTSFTENYKRLENKYDWKLPDARLSVLYNCLDVSANARLSVGLLACAKSYGLSDKDWWGKWALYDASVAFNRCPDFKIFVDDKCRQYIHRVQEQLLTTIQIYIESFLRNLGRQFDINEVYFWKLKEKLLEKILKFKNDELAALSAYQHLRNSLHNRGIHFNENYPDLELDINGYKFIFKHKESIKISWEHIRALLIANSDLLNKIIDSSKVSRLVSFNDQNVVILTDG